MATYCTASGVKLRLDSSAFSGVDRSGDFPSDSEIVDLIEINEGIINEMCGGVTFSTETVTEYYDHAGQSVLVLRNFPVVSITSMYELDSDSYQEMTATDPGDGSTTTKRYYLKDSDAGLIWLWSPITDTDAYKITYTYGYSSVPSYIQKICELMTCRDVVMRLHSACETPELQAEYRGAIKLLNTEINWLEDLITRQYRYRARSI